jgi:hypothetical protein
MSEPLAERLSRFTPDGSGLDRDELLFAAGRASARPNRAWAALAGVLAAGQLLTLALLWPRAAPPAVPPYVAPQPIQVVEAPSPPPARDPSVLWSLRQRLLDGAGGLPRPTPTAAMVPSGPPLRAFGPPPGSQD